MKILPIVLGMSIMTLFPINRILANGQIATVDCTTDQTYIENNVAFGCVPHDWSTTITDALPYDDTTAGVYQTLVESESTDQTNAQLLFEFLALDMDGKDANKNLKKILKRYYFTSNHRIPKNVKFKKSDRYFPGQRIARQTTTEEVDGEMIDIVYIWVLDRTDNFHGNGLYTLRYQGKHGSQQLEDLGTTVESISLNFSKIEIEY